MTFGGAYFGQPYFAGSPIIIVVIVVREFIPPTVAELVSSGANQFEITE